MAVTLIALAHRNIEATRLLAESLLRCQEPSGAIKNAFWADRLIGPMSECMPFPEEYGSDYRVGNLAWVAVALLHARHAHLESDPRFAERCLKSAQRMMDWVIRETLAENGFTGAQCRPNDDTIKSHCWVSTEHMVDLVAVGLALYKITGVSRYEQMAEHALHFIQQARVKKQSRLMTGTTDKLVVGEIKREDLNDEVMPLDPASYASMIPTHFASQEGLMDWASGSCQVDIELSTELVRGYHYRCSDKPEAREKHIPMWPEGHAQVVVALDALGKNEAREEALSALTKIIGAERAQRADRSRLLEVPAAYPKTLITGFHNHSYYAQPALAPTAWYLMALDRTNPFEVPGVKYPDKIAPKQIPAAARETLKMTTGLSPSREDLPRADPAYPWIATLDRLYDGLYLSCGPSPGEALDLIDGHHILAGLEPAQAMSCADPSSTLFKLGTGEVEVHYPAGQEWGAFYLAIGRASNQQFKANLSHYGFLEVEIKAHTSVTLGVVDDYRKADRLRWAAVSPSDDWQHIVIRLSELGPLDMTAVAQPFVLQFCESEAGEVEIRKVRDLAYAPTGGSPAPLVLNTCGSACGADLEACDHWPVYEQTVFAQPKHPKFAALDFMLTCMSNDSGETMECPASTPDSSCGAPAVQLLNQLGTTMTAFVQATPAVDLSAFRALRLRLVSDTRGLVVVGTKDELCTEADCGGIRIHRVVDGLTELCVSVEAWMGRHLTSVPFSLTITKPMRVDLLRARYDTTPCAVAR